MAQLRPNLLITDAYGSAGAVTAYHRNGKCFLRQRICPVFPGTSGQLASSSVHLRALQAWRSLPHEEQLRWEPLAQVVEPHRPPFDHLARISGNNLFISAYHGFATMGREHNAYLAPDGVYILYQPLEICFWPGEPVIVIPIDEAKPYLSSEAVKLLRTHP